jgi:hypothetical protein
LGSNVSEEPAAFILRANSTDNFSEPLVPIYQTAWLHIPEDLNLNNPCYTKAANWHRQVTYSALIVIEKAKVVA